MIAGSGGVWLAACSYSMRIEVSVYFFALMQKSNKKDQGCGEILAGKCREALLVKELARTIMNVGGRAGLKQLLPASRLARVSAPPPLPTTFSPGLRTPKA